MISAKDVGMFTRGACYILAGVIAEETGWPMYGFWGDDWVMDGRGGPQTHIFVKTPKGTYLDIKGEFTRKEMLTKWHEASIRKTSAQALANDGWNCDDTFDVDKCYNRAYELIPEVLALVREEDQ